MWIDEAEEVFEDMHYVWNTQFCFFHLVLNIAKGLEDLTASAAALWQAPVKLALVPGKPQKTRLNVRREWMIQKASPTSVLPMKLPRPNFQMCQIVSSIAW